MADQRVARLVEGDGGALVLGHDAALAGRPGDDALHGLGDLGHADAGPPTTGREQRGLVHKVAQVGTGEARGEVGDLVEVHVGGEGLVARVDLEDLLTPLYVGAVHRDLAVEAARTQKGRVEDVGTVRGRDEDHALVVLEAVHLNEELVQGLLAFVVAAAHAGTALTAHGVDLVDEDDRGSLLLGLREQVAHARGAHAHEHLDKARARDREERHAGLAGHGLGKQGLTGTRRAHEQHAAGNLGTDLLVLVGILKEVLDLLELLDGLVTAGDVVELDLGPRGVGGLGLGLAELHGTGVRVCKLVHEIDHDADEQQHGQQAREHRDPEGRGAHIGLVDDVGVSRHQLGERVLADVGRGVVGKLLVIADLVFFGPEGTLDGAEASRVGGLVDAVLVDGRHKLARGKLVDVPGVPLVHHTKDQKHQDGSDEQIQQDRAPVAAPVAVLPPIGAEQARKAALVHLVFLVVLLTPGGLFWLIGFVVAHDRTPWGPLAGPRRMSANDMGPYRCIRTGAVQNR